MTCILNDIDMSYSLLYDGMYCMLYLNGHVIVCDYTFSSRSSPNQRFLFCQSFWVHNPSRPPGFSFAAVQVVDKYEERKIGSPEPLKVS